MKKVLIAAGVVVLAVAGSLVAWQLLDDGPRREGAFLLRPSNVLTSPNGNFSLSVEDTGIVMKGLGSSVELTPGGLAIKSSGPLSIQGAAAVSLQGSLVNLGCSSGGKPVARVGDLVQVSGPGPSPIVQGSPTVLAC